MVPLRRRWWTGDGPSERPSELAVPLVKADEGELYLVSVTGRDVLST